VAEKRSTNLKQEHYTYKQQLLQVFTFFFDLKRSGGKGGLALWKLHSKSRVVIFIKNPTERDDRVTDTVSHLRQPLHRFKKMWDMSGVDVMNSSYQPIT